MARGLGTYTRSVRRLHFTLVHGHTHPLLAFLEWVIGQELGEPTNISCSDLQEHGHEVPLTSIKRLSSARVPVAFWMHVIRAEGVPLLVHRRPVTQFALASFLFACSRSARESGESRSLEFFNHSSPQNNQLYVLLSRIDLSLSSASFFSQVCCYQTSCTCRGKQTRVAAAALDRYWSDFAVDWHQSDCFSSPRIGQTLRFNP